MKKRILCITVLVFVYFMFTWTIPVVSQNTRTEAPGAAIPARGFFDSRIVDLLPQANTGTSRRIISGAALPATCSPNTGDVFFRTSAPIGPYYCSATNTWTRFDLSPSTPTLPWYDVKAFGAIGNGVAYDDTAILNTFIAADATGGVVLFPPGTYLVATSLAPVITKNVAVIGYGATLKRKYADYAGVGGIVGEAILWPYGTYTVALNQTLVTDTLEGTNNIVVPTSAGVAVGDGVLITSDEHYMAGGTYERAHMSIVTRIPDAFHITLADPVNVAFNGTTAVVLLKVYRNPPRFSIAGLNFEWDTSWTTLPVGLKNVGLTGPLWQINGLAVEGMFFPVIYDVRFKNTSGYGLKVDKVYGGLISHVSGATEAQVVDYGYGIGCYSNFNTVYDSVNIWATRHAFAASGYPSFDVVVNNSFFQSEVYDSGCSFDTHIHGRMMVTHCTIPNSVKYTGGEIYFTDCVVGNARNTYTFMNRGETSVQEVFECRNSRIVNYYETPGGTKSIWSPTATLNTFGSVRFLDNRIINEPVDGGVLFFYGPWHCDSLHELRVERNTYVSPNSYVINIAGYIDSFHTPGTPGTLILRGNDFPFLTIGTPIIEGGAASPYNVATWDYPYTFGQLALTGAVNGTFVYCSDCTFANPCAAVGTGALAKRINGAWICN